MSQFSAHSGVRLMARLLALLLLASATGCSSPWYHWQGATLFVLRKPATLGDLIATAGDPSKLERLSRNVVEIRIDGR